MMTQYRGYHYCMRSFLNILQKKNAKTTGDENKTKNKGQSFISLLCTRICNGQESVALLARSPHAPLQEGTCIASHRRKRCGRHRHACRSLRQRPSRERQHHLEKRSADLRLHFRGGKLPAALFERGEVGGRKPHSQAHPFAIVKISTILT